MLPIDSTFDISVFLGTTRGSKLKFNILQTAIPFSHFINARAVANFFVSNLGFGSIKTVVLSTLRGHLTDIYMPPLKQAQKNRTHCKYSCFLSVWCYQW